MRAKFNAYEQNKICTENRSKFAHIAKEQKKKRTIKMYKSKEKFMHR